MALIFEGGKMQMKEEIDYTDIEAQLENYLEILRGAVVDLSAKMDELQLNLSQARNKMIQEKEMNSQLLDKGSVHILG